MDDPENDSNFDDETVDNLMDAVDSEFSRTSELFEQPGYDIDQMSRDDRVTLASNDPILVCFLEHYKGVPPDTRKSVIFSEDQIEAINRFQPDQIKSAIQKRYNLTEEEYNLAVAKYHQDYLEITKDEI